MEWDGMVSCRLVALCPRCSRDTIRNGNVGVCEGMWNQESGSIDNIK
jgi:hypothetical protein